MTTTSHPAVYSPAPIISTLGQRFAMLMLFVTIQAYSATKATQHQWYTKGTGERAADKAASRSSNARYHQQTSMHTQMIFVALTFEAGHTKMGVLAAHGILPSQTNRSIASQRFG